MSQAGRYFSNSAAPGTTLFLEGNTGGPVGPDVTGTIFVVGSGDINIAGNALTNTLTASITAGSLIATITGDSGGAETPDSSGNFNILGGTTGLTFAGTSHTETLSGTLGVAHGGTGDTSFTVYAPITGGITTTGSLQSASTGISNSGFVLTSTGAASLPTWQATSASGIITVDGNSGHASGSTITLTTGAGNTNGTALVTGDNASTLTLTFTDSNTNTGLGSGVFSDPGFVGNDNTALGRRAGFSVTSANSNTLIGSDAGINVTTGGNNTILGQFGAFDLITGNSNTILGISSGSSYGGAESENILINDAGINGESKALHIGGTSGLNAAYISGIYSVTPGLASPLPVIIDSNGQLGTGFSSIVSFTQVTSSPYIVTSTDYFLGVTTTSIAITIELPNGPTTGQIYVIKDTTGNAATHNITVKTVGGIVNIDGATSQILATNYQSINLLFDGSGYKIY